MSDKLILRREGDVLHICLNRPEVRNALDEELIAAVTTALRHDARDEQTRVVVLQGEGKVFCAGADLQYMQKLSAADHATNLEDARHLGELFSAVSDCPKPVIAQVHGAAIGGGVGLVAASDFVVAAEGTKFGFTETRLGIVPGVISPFALRRLGPAVCRRLFLTAEIFDAHRALEIGLVDHCVAPTELQATTASIIDQLRAAGPKAQAAAKRLLDEIGNLPVEDAVAQAPEHIANQRASREAREGIAAFLEKRSPAWARPEK
jgi:methylglutaconyl-CoA hydratase